MDRNELYSSDLVGLISSPPIQIKKHDDEVKQEDQQDDHYGKKVIAKKMKRKRDMESPNASKLPSSSPGKRSSIYRGVSRHRWTGRYEAHLWDKSSWNETQKKKGKQVYLGAYDEEEAAARAYDLAALKYWGASGTITNFPLSDYAKDLEAMQNVTREEYLASLRRKSSGFSRGLSKYRGVARHHQNGRWEARIGRVFGNKYLYLGTYSTQEEAAAAYDIAAIEYRGLNAVTNFDLSSYLRWLRPEHMANKPPNTVQDVQTKAVEEAIQYQSYTNLPSSSTLNAKAVRSSSTTALDLLLQSSVFKKMVEETTYEGEDTACVTRFSKGSQSSTEYDPSRHGSNNFAYSDQNIQSNRFSYSHDDQVQNFDDPFACISNTQFVAQHQPISLDQGSPLVNIFNCT